VATQLMAASVGSLEKFVGDSPWSVRIRAEIEQVARHSANVLITGPSGTGKELVAQAIHENSPRSDQPFIPVDCASITGSLFGSHLFGHLKGSFSGASYSTLGSFRAADGGTIFLDEIGELEPNLQAKLLRTLQQRAVVPVGSHEEVPVDVRIVAATNRELDLEVAEGRFREDLFFRLNVVSLVTEPLCQRPQDIEILAEHILAKLNIRHGLPLKRISRGAIRRLEEYHWPGNVRELENVLERAVLFTRAEVIQPAELDQWIEPGSAGKFNKSSWAQTQRSVSRLRIEAADHSSESSPLHDPRQSSWPKMEDVQCEHIQATLAHTSFNQAEAARLLGMDRYVLRRKMVKFGISFSRSKRGRPRMQPR